MSLDAVMAGRYNPVRPIFALDFFFFFTFVGNTEMNAMNETISSFYPVS